MGSIMLAQNQSPPYTLGPLDLGGMARLARVIAPTLKAGDALTLKGEIGAGKTAFSRFLIRALTGDSAMDVPSPAFSLHQTYDMPNFRISHFDFYRLKHESEVAELGLADALAGDVTIIEWPERTGGAVMGDGLQLILTETANTDARIVTLTGCGRFAVKAARLVAIFAFLNNGQWAEATIEPLTGDASTRVYYRLRRGDETALLMDWPRQPDGPPIRDGKPYSQIAQLAEGVPQFVTIAEALRKTGLGVPTIYQTDLDSGLLILEDFGDDVFQSLATSGQDMEPLWRLAVDGLIPLRQYKPPETLMAGGDEIPMRRYDHEALGIETELLLDWYLPEMSGAAPSTEARDDFLNLWRGHFDWLAAQTHEIGWVLRDYHSPNLLLRDGEGAPRLGVIDFQDALIGHRAYDLAALLQDARVDVPQTLEQDLLAYYLTAA
ncbi:MAG: tRNA (adenosine(37)-N6)-threonylcarbamoyltransferase complex ATPase subunit type 1 TsaE, partial [Chitinophagales bacterium]|nr:tRNA (adenosine(37)-N6)-threonylcarbamoyltransferase complex ATPase subunit type 1 TsaE [Hyphomicrobiales bacterium]